MTPLHPMFFEMLAKGRGMRTRLQDTLRPRLGDHVGTGAESFLASLPMLLNEAGSRAVQKEVARVMEGVRRRMLQEPRWQDTWGWSHLPDVITVDAAFVAVESGWECRIVEFQAFQTAAASGFLIDQACRELWPCLDGFQGWGGPTQSEAWARRATAWLAPGALPLLVDCQPHRQYTRWDFRAGQEVFGMAIADVRDLVVDGHDVWCWCDGGRRAVGSISNRAVPPDLDGLPEGPRIRRTLDALPIPCFSHPAWYERIHKGWLPDLDLPTHQRCIRADAEEAQALALESYVLKDARSCGGKGVRLEVSHQDLANLESPAHWVLQPKFRPLVLFRDDHGQAIHGECRIMLGLDQALRGWPMMCLIRLSRSRLANARGMDGSPHTGLAVLYMEGLEGWDGV